MGAILQSLPRTIIAGIVITVLMIVLTNILYDMQTETVGEKADKVLNSITGN